jgi:hypothetical protein
MAYQQTASSTFQPCETFFVESADDVPHRLDPKEHARLVARERQYVMADELSRLTSDEYQDDILSHMLEMDVSVLSSLSVWDTSY